MAVNVREEDEEIKPDMTPMIDIIFLLLIFFLLTTKFIPDEKFITSLLPTNKGQANTSQQDIEPPEDCNIMVYPAGMSRGQQPSFYDNEWKTKREVRVAKCRVGAGLEIEIQGHLLSFGSSDAKKWAVVQEVHAYLHEELKKREQGSALRKDEDPVVINCFSGMPWKYAILVYDAVREYERQQTGKGLGNPSDLLEAREVNFAPPRIRDYHEWELGNELWEIIHKK